MGETLEDSKRLLVRRWGEMGGYWGISRTMAEMHALLFVSTEPLCTDDVMEELRISRGNASTSLRALVDWGLIERVHKLGDRKEYFQADTDVRHMFETIMRERRRREVEPIIATIDRCGELVAGAEDETGEDARVFCDRLAELQSFLAGMSTLFELVLRFGNNGVVRLATMLAGGTGKSGADVGAQAGDTGRSKKATKRKKAP